MGRRLRGQPAWTRIYRALNHRQAADACRNAQSGPLPESIWDFAEDFVELQDARHEADYDPDKVFLKSDVRALMGRATRGLEELQAASADDRKILATAVLFRRRG